jgi:hypothetical protein
MLRGKLLEVTQITATDRLCYTARMPDDVPAGDDPADTERSAVRLFEDGLEIGPAHALHAVIARDGGGAFSHWGRLLYFSSSDRSDPVSNGRRYTVLYGQDVTRHHSVLVAALAVDMDTLPPEQRYAWGERLFNAVVPDVRLSEYGRSVFTDAEFRTDYERFDRDNYRSYDRKFALRELLKLTHRLPGDVAECGVYRGGSSYLMAKELARCAPAKRLHLFDSFAGLSTPGPLDGGHWRAGALVCALPEVRANLAEYAGLLDIHVGWIPDCFREAVDRSFCFVHIDVDLYEPTLASLEFFGPRLVSGGIIVCDDYGFDTCPGARRAVDEFAAARKIEVVHLPTGQGILVPADLEGR